MNFRQRFLRFLIGVFIGFGLVYMFFNDKLNVLSDWTPKNRVKARITESYYVPNPKSDCLIDCVSSSWDSLMNDVKGFDVDFSRSKTKGETKEYHLITNEQAEGYFRFAVRDSSVWLVGLKTDVDCECN